MAEIAERVSPFWTTWILWVSSEFVVGCSLFVARIAEAGSPLCFVSEAGSALPPSLKLWRTGRCVSLLVFGISVSGGMGEVTGEDAIGVVFGEGFILEAAWNARACALRFGRVASQRTAPVASVTPIARPILKSFCISPTQNTNVRGKGPLRQQSSGQAAPFSSVLLLLRGGFVDRRSCPY